MTAAEFFEIARYDWLDTLTGRTLHAYDTGDFDEEYWGVRGGRFACGRRFALAVIPGLVTRMAAMRCKGCCRATGLPEGKGSPKNDDACRPLVGLSTNTPKPPLPRVHEATP